MLKILQGGFLEGKKTYITSIVGIITGVSAYLIGDMGLPELIQTIFPLFGIIFLRKGIDNK